jgi:hypothetical protein
MRGVVVPTSLNSHYSDDDGPRIIIIQIQTRGKNRGMQKPLVINGCFYGQCAGIWMSRGNQCVQTCGGFCPPRTHLSEIDPRQCESRHLDGLGGARQGRWGPDGPNRFVEGFWEHFCANVGHIPPLLEKVLYKSM